ncbi:MAG: hypothetical protein ACN4GM_05095 [Gammaproteobacteria bacterium]
MIRWLLIGIGAITVLSGIVTFLLPIPIGLPLILLGMPLLMRYSPLARGWILQFAKVSPRAHKYLSKIQIKQAGDK